MDRSHRLTTWASAAAAFLGATLISAGCIGNCDKYCANFDPEIRSDTFDVEIWGEDASAHYATELSEVEITDDQVVFRYIDLDGNPAEVVWDIVAGDPA